jgi:hypothetical protein
MPQRHSSDRRGAGALASTVLFLAGAALAMSFLHSSWDWSVVAAAAGGCTVAWAGCTWRASVSPLRRWVGILCCLAVLGAYVLWSYLALSFGVLLAWTMPLWMVAAIAVCAIASVVTIARPRRGFFVPLALPLGLWIAALLSGWLREEALTRCDDYLALRAPARLVVPSHPDLATCRPGELRPSGRFPRTTWEAPAGDRVIFTTQGQMRPGGIDGAVCEARLDGQSPPRCVGPPHNKSQGLMEWPEEKRLLVLQWGIRIPSGALGGVVYELPQEPGIEILGQHFFDEMIGEGFFEPSNSTLYMFSDRMNGVHRALLPSFALQPVIPSDLLPGELRYDQTRGEGVACGNAIGVAIRGNPFSARDFVDANPSPVDRFSTSWGCDWDPAAGKVYSAVPNLGLLDRIDYATGRVEKRWFVGLGRRSVAYDPERRRVYFTDFLRGEVLAFDEDSERIVARWFVGRWSRWVRLTRDRRALLATSNLGIVRIALADAT